MSKVLMIRHLPTTLSFQDKEQLLKHFGAENVWEMRCKRNYIFASFNNEEKAKASLTRLHQLEIAQRRLVVEYSYDKEPEASKKPSTEQNSETTNIIKEFLKTLNAWNPSIDFYQPPPVNLRYKYPDIGPETAVNILYYMYSHKPFYVQALHLMNKMSLDTPFRENEKALAFFKDTFKQFFVDMMQPLAPQLPSSETESEISSAEDEQKVKEVQKITKRKRKLPVPKIHPTNILTMQPLPPKIKKKAINQEEVFETVTPIVESKKILLNLHQDALQKPCEQPVVIGELGKFQREEQPLEVEENKVEPEQPTVTKKELLRNRISYRDMRVLPVFKNYHPGEPSMRLYIKNLAKTVTDAVRGR